MTDLHISDSVKAIREMLCHVQFLNNNSVYNGAGKMHRSQLLQRLINECDRHRPLGVNGKHGNLHTDTCGCEDKGPRELWGTTTPLSVGPIGDDISPGVVHGGMWQSPDTWCDLEASNVRIAATFDEITCENCRAEILRNC